MVKLFSKSFERRRLFSKRRHLKTFLIFYQRSVFKQSLICPENGADPDPARAHAARKAGRRWK
ncbi:hypothetical protein CXP35_03650 [Komagataeibacter xylinus]|nr:hypothetical protein CXP35_03650 [Komagataeibacter xylinus]